MVIDVEKCEDCNNCFLSCKDEHVDNHFPGYSEPQPLHGHRWMNIMRKERGQFPIIDVAYLPMPCMHCENAPCINAARDGAVYKRKDGIVIIDAEKARGQEDIVKACPYGSVWWNKEREIPQKCTFCGHLLDEGWRQTRCAQACPTGALRVVHAEGEEMEAIVRSENLEVLHPEYRTRPRVYYKNLYRYFRCFIGGSVAFENNGVLDCAEGAKVSLRKDAQVIEKTLTDHFGDFKFDGLEEHSGKYAIEILFRDYEKKHLNIDLKTSLNAGVIVL
jgi:Fe-S-cluster-containing dehydrogenase component